MTIIIIKWSIFKKKIKPMHLPFEIKENGTECINCENEKKQ